MFLFNSTPWPTYMFDILVYATISHGLTSQTKQNTQDAYGCYAQNICQGNWKEEPMLLGYVTDLDQRQGYDSFPVCSNTGCKL